MMSAYMIRPALLAMALSLMAVTPLSAAGVAAPLDRPAVSTVHAARSALMDITKAGARLVAVGERGIVILSDDQGKSWRQAQVPVSVTLNAVRFADARSGWAAGHYGTVLHTADGGETWQRQLDGVQAARLMLEAARGGAGAGAQPASAQALAKAEQLVRDGPDKPFFDLYFENGLTGYVVGAYNLIFGTNDGGKTWQPLSDRLDNPNDAHLYAIRAAGGHVYISGEQGLLLRADADGKRFVRLAMPYQGSYFALAVYPSGELIAAGLRGNLYRSADQGASWERSDSGTTVSFLAATATDNGRLLLANQAGQIFDSADRGRTVRALPAGNLPPLTQIVLLPDNSLVATSLQGVVRIPATR